MNKACKQLLRWYDNLDDVSPYFAALMDLIVVWIPMSLLMIFFCIFVPIIPLFFFLGAAPGFVFSAIYVFTSARRRARESNEHNPRLDGRHAKAIRSRKPGLCDDKP